MRRLLSWLNMLASMAVKQNMQLWGMRYRHSFTARDITYCLITTATDTLLCIVGPNPNCTRADTIIDRSCKRSNYMVPLFYLSKKYMAQLIGYRSA